MKKVIPLLRASFPMFQAIRMTLIALAFAAALIGASSLTKGLWYQNYVDMGLYSAFIVWLSCETACGKCCGAKCRTR
jgi:hypothetical protein